MKFASVSPAWTSLAPSKLEPYTVFESVDANDKTPRFIGLLGFVLVMCGKCMLAGAEGSSGETVPYRRKSAICVCEIRSHWARRAKK
jgi:hypothetical protein